MQKVWSTIDKKAKKPGSELVVFQVAYSLSSENVHLNAKEYSEKFKKFAQDARKLARTLRQDLGLDCDRLLLTPDSAVTMLGGAAQKSFLELNPYSWFPDEVVTTILQSIESVTPLAATFSAYEQLLKHPTKGATRLLFLLPETPMLDKLLDSMAEKADSIADACLTEMEVTPYHGVAKARRNYFVRHMADFFNKLLGSPHYDMLTNFSGVVLQDPDLRVDMVREIVRSQSRRK